MADLVEERKNIQVEETRFKAALAQSLFSRLGAAVNFINKRHYYQHDWNLNGPYNAVPAPQLAVDGYITYNFPFKIEDVQMFTGAVNGSSGITEFDIKWRPENSGSWVSIFSTTPKFNSSAATFTSVRVGQTVTNFTAPVLSKTDFDAYDQLRLDVIQQVGGLPEGAFLKLWMRPR